MKTCYSEYFFFKIIYYSSCLFEGFNDCILTNDMILYTKYWKCFICKNMGCSECIRLWSKLTFQYDSTTVIMNCNKIMLYYKLCK